LLRRSTLPFHAPALELSTRGALATPLLSLLLLLLLLLLWVLLRVLLWVLLLGECSCCPCEFKFGGLVGGNDASHEL
jgi:hypothetical protein